jgi:hypothetical protein
MMLIEVPLAPEAEQALRRRAAATGKDISAVASQLLTQALTAGTPLTPERLLDQRQHSATLPFYRHHR